MKPIYKPSKMYSEDINDLVEAELEKGGKGSGVKGHRTRYSTRQGGTAEIKPHHSGKGHVVYYEGNETAGRHRTITEAQSAAKKYTGFKD